MEQKKVFVSAKARKGFTLVELLVVITIIGMLIALLLPAVNAAREEGGVPPAQDNQNQISLALISYANAHSAFRAGGTTLPPTPIQLRQLSCRGQR